MLRTFLPLLALLPAPGALAAPAPLPVAPPSLAQMAAPALLAYETAPPPASLHPSLYSFADAYRLALSGERLGELRDGPRFAEAQARVRSVSQRAVEAAPELRFAVSAPRDGARWPLLLAGLFACAWVAHRRLSSPY